MVRMGVKKIALIDIDGTLVKGQTQVFLMKYLYRKKLIKTSALLEVLFWYFKYKFLNQEIDQDMAKKFYQQLFRGKSEEEVNEIINDYFDHCLRNKIYLKSSELIKRYRDNDFEIILFSATISPVAKKLVEFFKADSYLSTELEIRDGKYTGLVKGGIFIGLNRAHVIRQMICSLKKIDRIAILSDRFSDKEIFLLADEPVAINPDKKLRNFAKKENWEIIDL
ncbi:hypothetical protein C4544_01505 [candidate division WS5 bacterium]|uniref:HAD-IB family hydrolase n=1 Tax=candidate division WS5 bacterium TaxID=2093353 RepID=A0A419DFS3_9BACT|nr:MAG: hypothetical protein C4544_01505 [candidate division WS5 bacterium]